VCGNVVEVRRLRRGARPQVGAAGLQQMVTVFSSAIARQHQLHLLWGNGFGRPLIQSLQHLHGAGGLGLGAFHFELLVAVGDFYVQSQLDGAQVFVDRAAQMRQTGVVMRGEGVAKNQVDNLSKEPPNDRQDVIGKLSGILSEKNPPQVLVDCNGVGYEVDVPMSTFYNLPANGEKVSLLTHFVVREDAQILFGFGTASERATFRLLIKISGVGPRMALGILSGLSADELARAVSDQDAGRLTKVPGIGKKTAERLLLELKGKFGADLGLTGQTPQIDSQLEILQALLSLGYSDKEAQLALKQVSPGSSVSDGIRLALKALSKA